MFRSMMVKQTKNLLADFYQHISSIPVLVATKGGGDSGSRSSVAV